MVRVDIKLLYPYSKEPKKGTANSAAYDCYATSREVLMGRVIYGLGFALDPMGHKVTLKARSSVHKTGLILANGVGLGDPDYRGEYKVVFYNLIPELPSYQIGERVCQLEIEEAKTFIFVPQDELSDTERGEGGFGSTGQK